MRFSRTTEYALRTLAHMARDPGHPHSAHDLHLELGIPRSYLQRLLTDLTKHRLVRSTRGRRGGYVLGRNLRRITLADIVAAVQGLERSPQCFFGFGTCPLDAPCPMHRRWVRHQRALVRTLTTTTLADLIAAPRR